MKKTFKNVLLIVFILVSASCSKSKNESDGSQPSNENVSQLNSWNEGPSKDRITAFVEKTTDPTSADFIPINERIAVFDNDGTLWSEQPIYFQLFYAVDFIKKHAAEHSEWSKSEAIQAILNDDLNGALAGGEKALAELMMVSHANMTEDEFASSVQEWLSTSKHPKTGIPFNEMIYQPMVELLDYLRDHGYKTFIVSGGGIDFLRVWAEEAYGIPPYQVVGSSLKAKFEEVDEKLQILKIPELNFFDDKAGKPVGIHQHIGMKPTIAVGNSDGDYEMLEYTTNSDGLRLGIYIHHTDSIREYAYDRESSIGKLVKGLDDAEKNHWLVVDMAKDWKLIYPN